jgi:hypothetical protein
MRISRFFVKNYKSFADRGGEASLTPNINVIIGQNNVGKTALLEAVSVRLNAGAHRSVTTHPTPDAVVDIRPTVEIDVIFGDQEVREIVADNGGHFVLQAPNGNAATAIQRLEQSFAPQGTFRFVFGGTTAEARLLEYPNDGGAQIHFDIRRPGLELQPAGGGPQIPFANVVMGVVPSRIYLFGAERFNVGECAFGNSSLLAPNAQNLPEVLNLLQANPVRFRRFNELVRRVLPQVRWISAEAVTNNRVRLLVWTIDPNIGRPDLAVPLSQSGTGVGQVLAILYVVTQSIHPQVIVIDEPQSFLHPGAVRKLLEVLREYPQHQFIISTHSPVAVTAAEAETLLLVRNVDGLSSLHPTRLAEAKETKILLADLGVRFEDVFGFDRVLWVEGKTEELCFPMIIQHLVRRPLAGTAIIGLVATGDFEARHGNLAFDVYRRLSESTVLVPPTVGFVFDKERRTDRQVEDLTRRGDGRVHFLPRRMYENYLLNAKAIAAVPAGIEGFGAIDSGTVRAWLEREKWSPDVFRPGPVPGPRTEEAWCINVSGAVVLGRVFTDLSEARVVYDKVKHGVALTDWLLANNPEELRSIAEFLSVFLPAAD